MKKYLLTLLAIFVILAPNVKAEVINVSYPDSQKWLFSNYGSGDTSSTTFLKPDYILSKYDLAYMYNRLLEKYNSTYKETYKYYYVNFFNESLPNGKLLSNRMVFHLFKEIPTIGKSSDFEIIMEFKDDTYTYYDLEDMNVMEYYFPIISPISSNDLIYDPLLLYDANFDILNTSKDTYVIKDLNLTFKPNDKFLTYLSTEQDKMTTINLDNYEYVILNLKDYNQDKAFNTNLKVKGSIGITPIYNFGQTAKDDIMGSKVQDRCNVKYDDYTDYRLSILKQDLQNNSFYVVKACEVGSSFKFDNTIFDITYVDENNKSDPIVSIGGKDYHVIPFDKLPSSANQNEKENYVPGESERFALLDKLDFLINNLNRVWDAFTSFMGFVGKMFSTLPDEFKAIAISSFTIGCTLMIFKIIKSLK